MDELAQTFIISDLKINSNARECFLSIQKFSINITFQSFGKETGLEQVCVCILDQFSGMCKTFLRLHFFIWKMAFPSRMRVKIYGLNYIIQDIKWALV